MSKTLIAAIAGPVLVLFISELFRYLNSKKEKKERFFYEVFPKRMELYEEIVKAIDYIGDTEIPFQCKSSWELSTFYKEKCNMLAALGFRCCMFGSAQISAAITVLHGMQAEISKRALDLNDPLNVDVKQILIESFTQKAISIQGRLFELIREESGVYIIDDKIADFLRDFKKKQRSSKSVDKEK